MVKKCSHIHIKKTTINYSVSSVINCLLNENLSECLRHPLLTTRRHVTTKRRVVSDRLP